MRETYQKILECMGDDELTRTEIAEKFIQKYGDIITPHTVMCSVCLMTRRKLLFVVRRVQTHHQGGRTNIYKKGPEALKHNI